MRKVGILIASAATFAWASASSAAIIMIDGPITPGTNTYEIILSYTTAESVGGYATSLNTSGTYTGAFTNTPAPGFVITLPFNNPPTNGGTGTIGSWGATGFSAVAGQTVSIGSVEIIVAAGDTVYPFFTPADGVVTDVGLLVQTDLFGVTIIPEPSTALLVSTGLIALAVRRRGSRVAPARAQR